MPPPGDLARAINPKTVQTPALDIIGAELVRAYSTRDARLIVSMPPQEGKSERVTKTGNLSALLQDPGRRFAIASYSQELAEKFGRDIRNWIVSNDGEDGDLDLDLDLDLGLRVARDDGEHHRFRRRRDGLPRRPGAGGSDEGPTIVVQRSRITVLLKQNGSLEATVEGLTAEYTKLYKEAKASGATPTTVAPQALQGAAGATGAIGASGRDGYDGRGVVSMQCISTGLTVTYSDGSTATVGTCLGANGKDGATGATGTAGATGEQGATSAWARQERLDRRAPPGRPARTGSDSPPSPASRRPLVTRSPFPSPTAPPTTSPATAPLRPPRPPPQHPRQ